MDVPLKPHKCPTCERHFERRSGVRRHRTQPLSQCYSYRNVSFTSANDRHVFNNHDNLSDSEDEGIDHVDFDYSDPATSQDTNHSNVYIETFPGAGSLFANTGETFMDDFNNDAFAEERKTNPFYPFASRDDWEVGSWLYSSGLSLALINKFLSLQLVKKMKVSFSSAKELRSRIEMLPTGPIWLSKEVPTEQPTLQKVFLYYRNASHCLQALLRNPLFSDNLEFAPYRVYEDVTKQVRLFTEWFTGDVAWEMQSSLPQGATLLGTILSSDKTCISIMTGNRSAYPLLISLTNIKKDFRLKNSHGTFMLLALLPIAKFVSHNKTIRSALHDRLIHACLDHILLPLKAAAHQGILMSDPLGFQRFCFPVLASYTVDTPEAQLLACVGTKSSPITVADYKQFGDRYQHTFRTTDSTLKLIEDAQKATSSTDLVDYLKEAKKSRLNGVQLPFWRNWRFSQPCVFLTPEPLHHWHKQFWDHDCKWCIRILGTMEIDFRYMLLKTLTGNRQFKEGISKLKQVTGRDQREIEKYIVSVIAGGVSNEVVLAIRYLMDFRYLGQAPVLTSTTCRQMLECLQGFHANKDAIMAAKGRVGKGGSPLEHWQITKLELFQSVVSNIIANGVPSQYSADITEHAHITEIKNPARSGNNQSYDQQIVRALDRHDKCRRFDLATSIRHANVSLEADECGEMSSEDEVDEHGNDGAPHRRVDTTSQLLSHISPTIKINLDGTRAIVDYFDSAKKLATGGFYNAPKPYRTFSMGNTAFRLTRKPSIKEISIADAALMFNLPDLAGALREYQHLFETHGDMARVVGGRRHTSSSRELPFDSLQIWYRVRIQNHTFHPPHYILPAQTLNCQPPSPDVWAYGHYDSVLLNTSPEAIWPTSRLTGHSVVQIRLLMLPVMPRGSVYGGFNQYLAYVQRFNITPQNGIANASNPFTGMYSLRRALRSDGTRQGDIVPIKYFRTPVMLVPRHGTKADPRLSKENALEFGSEFWLNNYYSKEFFYCIRDGG